MSIEFSTQRGGGRDGGLHRRTMHSRASIPTEDQNGLLQESIPGQMATAGRAAFRARTVWDG